MTYTFDPNTKTLSVMLTRGEHTQMMIFRSMEGRRMEAAIKEKIDHFAEQHGSCEAKMIVKNED